MSYLKDFIPANYLIYKGKSEASAEAEAILPDYYPSVMRIIRTEAVPFIRSKTVYGEKLAVEGNVEFRVLYQSDKGDFNSFFYKAPFSHAIEIQNLQDASFAVDSNIEYKDIRALSPQKLSLRASVSLSAYAVRSENKEILSEDRETSGDVAVLSSEETFCREINRVSKLVRHSGDISLEGKTPVDKILRYEIGFSNTEFKPMNKKTLIKSDMTMKILCINAESKKPILIEEKTVVSQLLDVDTVDDDSVAIISPKVADIRFDLKENSEGKVSGIEYNAEIDVTFVDDAEIRRLNKQFRDIDQPTDVLSFPLGENGEYDRNPETGAAMLGDVVISLERAEKQAKDYGHSFQREVAYLTAHSVLHLLGYDHVDGGIDAVHMREKEETVMNQLGLPRSASYVMEELL